LNLIHERQLTKGSQEIIYSQKPFFYLSGIIFNEIFTDSLAESFFPELDTILWYLMKLSKI